MTATGPHRPHHQPRPRRQHGQYASGRRVLSRVVVPAGAAAALTAGAISYGVLSGSPAPRSVSGGHAAHAATPAQHATLAAKVLAVAAATVARQTSRVPAAGQWFYTATTYYGYGQRPAMTRDDEWNTFDGAKTAYFVNGQIVVHQGVKPASPSGVTALDAFDAFPTPRTAYRALASLPASPTALLAEIGAQIAKDGPSANFGPFTEPASASPGQLEFAYLAGLLWNAYDGAPAAAVAAVYRAMADIPGVTVRQGVTDLAGRPAVALSADGINELLLNPATFQVTGWRQLSTGKPVPHAAAGLPPAGTKANGHTASWPAKGTVLEAITHVRVTAVRGPGVR